MKCVLDTIERILFDSGLKLKEKYFGPYRLTTIKINDRYDGEKVGIHVGPFVASNEAEHLKP